MDGLYNDRDVASQITAQFLTGTTWQTNGVRDRKVKRHTYSSKFIGALERGPLARVDKGRDKRHGIYKAMRWGDTVERDYLAVDIECPTLFDLVDDSKAVCVPSYNPEPGTALDRNILDPRRHPDLGFQGALDLREKNYLWRSSILMEALRNDPTHSLLVGQIQYIDSTQHLYLDYAEPPDMEEVEAAYWRMDGLAGKILESAEGKYDRILFFSDNGAARKDGFRPTHFNRPFYSVNASLGLERPNIRGFFFHVLDWLTQEPNPEPVHSRK